MICGWNNASVNSPRNAFSQTTKEKFLQTFGIVNPKATFAVPF